MIGDGIEFVKMSGHGNDFLFVDNRDGRVPGHEMPGLTEAACRRQYGVGADGMVFIEKGEGGVDFVWRFYNRDGSEADMCGNAARCAARFAVMKGIAGPKLSFLTKAGVIEAEVAPDKVKILLTPPGEAELDCTLDVEGDTLTFCGMDTGVPHVVTWVPDIESVKVYNIGRAVRFHPSYQPAGTNVNFVQRTGDDFLSVRTYERGVEDETLACGTGVIASVLLSAHKGMVASPTRVLTRGGEELGVYFSKDGDRFTDVFLEGPVRVICTGRLGPDVMLD